MISWQSLPPIITLFQPISKGIFQDIPLEMYLKNFAESLDEGTSHIAAALGGGQDSRLLQSGHFGG